MNAHLTTERSGIRRIGAQYWATASGIIVALAMASGMAVAFATVVDRVTVYGATTEVVSGVRPSLPALRIADRRIDAPKVATSASFAHVVDRWFDEPAVATALGER